MATIGLVDDSVILRSALKSVLENSGYSIVIEAGDSSELFEKLKTTQPQLILLDVFFPSENGLDILACIKKQYPAIKILLVTGLRQDSIAEEAKRLGASYILYKPFDTKELLQALKKV